MGFALFYLPCCLGRYSGLRFFRCGGGLDGSNGEDVIFANLLRFFAGSEPIYPDLSTSEPPAQLAIDFLAFDPDRVPRRLSSRRLISLTQRQRFRRIGGCSPEGFLSLSHAHPPSVARQSGWEGGDDQECILTVAAD
jgi:hypothetical protein